MGREKSPVFVQIGKKEESGVELGNRVCFVQKKTSSRCTDGMTCNGRGRDDDDAPHPDDAKVEEVQASSCWRYSCCNNSLGDNPVHSTKRCRRCTYDNRKLPCRRLSDCFSYESKSIMAVCNTGQSHDNAIPPVQQG